MREGRDPNVRVRPLEPEDRAWADDLLARHMGGTRMTARLGEVLDPLSLPGRVAERDGRRIGLLTYQVAGDELEVFSLHSDVQRLGAGTALLRAAEEVARASGCRRMWLVTTNDNTNAIDFYHRRGMRLARVHEGAVDADRVLKPEIPAFNADTGEAVRDVLEFELELRHASAAAPPAVTELNALDVDGFMAATGPLFERAPRFLRRLAEARPFESDADLMRAAREVARDLPEEEQLELLDAHPRIGADPTTVSALSRVEQGYGPSEPDDGSDPGDAARVDEAWIADELAALNEAYEQRFGFRFVIFVAGRPRREIIPILERALRADRDEEMRRGLDDVVHIAADRLAKLRGAEP